MNQTFFGQPEEQFPKYNEEQMLRLVKKDRFLQFALNDLRGKGHAQSYALEVLFNSCVLEDSSFTVDYEACTE